MVVMGGERYVFLSIAAAKYTPTLQQLLKTKQKFCK